MLIVLCSPHALMRNGIPDVEVIDVLKKAKAAGNPVAILSNLGEPSWFKTAFAGSKVQFMQVPGRQTGEIIALNAKRLQLQPFDCLVLAATQNDIRMGKNGGGVLVAAGWSADPEVDALGIRVESPAQLDQVIELSSSWKGSWWFSGKGQKYSVRALADLSSMYAADDQAAFGKALTAVVKAGGPKLTALLAVTARSLLTDQTAGIARMWAVYPSSSSRNDDTEILSDFTQRLRTTVSSVRFAARTHPLFIRHMASRKRSRAGLSIDQRTDPTDQLTTLHLNPYYRDRLKNRHVVVVDDCTTYGVSFGVAAALLDAAGAGGVTGVALGKFGNQLREYDIRVTGDPFAPLSLSDFSCDLLGMLAGNQSSTSQQALLHLLK